MATKHDTRPWTSSRSKKGMIFRPTEEPAPPSLVVLNNDVQTAKKQIAQPRSVLVSIMILGNRETRCCPSLHQRFHSGHLLCAPANCDWSLFGHHVTHLR